MYQFGRADVMCIYREVAVGIWDYGAEKDLVRGINLTTADPPKAIK